MKEKITNKEYRRIKRFVWNRIKTLPTKERMTDAGGLGTIVEAFDESVLARKLEECLPSRTGNRTHGSYRLALTLISSFIYGHDCLDDLEWFRKDPYLKESLDGKVSAPRTMGDFLRDFDDEHIEKLNLFLVQMQRTYRKCFNTMLEPRYRSQVLVQDIDSTDHEQSGDEMEGLAWNYKGHWCLDSQVAYDDYGLCGGLQLRPGNTKSGVGAEDLIAQIFSGIKFKEEKRLRADSAYCEKDVIETCIRLGVRFTIAAHDGYTGWKERRSEITNWEEWAYSQSQIEKSLKLGQRLPKIELGRIYWSPGWAKNLRIPVIIKRTWKEGEHKKITKKHKRQSTDQIRLPFDIEESGYWEYYAIVTNENLFEKSFQEVFEFYKKRGNAERFIREEKYGYDLKHLPCQKLKANHAYALMGMIAHNILRWAAILEQPDKPNFSKKMRKRFIHVPGKLVSHARQLTLRIPERYYEEVMRLKEQLTALRDLPLLDTC